MKERPEKLTDELIEQIARDALDNSLGGPETEIGRIRLRNIEAFNAQADGEFAPPEVEDRSDFVDTTVADTVNGMLPQLLQMFVSSDDAVEFEGRGQPGSDMEAKLATAFINHLFYVENDGVSILHDWFWDALTQKVGFVKVWAEEEADDSKQKYEGVTEEQLVMLMQEGWQLDGEPEVDEQGTLAFTVVMLDRRKCIKARVVAPHEMRVDVNARWDDDPAMIGHVFYKRRFEWEQDGYDVSDAGNAGDRSDREALELLGDSDDVGSSAPHRSHDLIRGAELYIKLDADADGVAEWVKVCLVEDTLGRYADGKPAWEQVDGHPFVWVCPEPRPHTFYGDCPADHAYQPQKLRTQTVRLIQDNMLLTVNQRTYVNTRAGVNVDDLLDSRAGGVVRGETAMTEAMAPIVQPNLGAPAYQFNEWVGSWAENRTGFNRYSAGTDANALNKTARGTELLTAKADMRMGLMARHFAIGVRKLFAKFLKLSIQHQNVEQMVKLNGQFVPINPSEFKHQLRVKINVGLGTGTKEQQSARILSLLQVMGQGAMSGIVRPQHMAEAIRLYVEANEFKNPERFVDPEPSGMPPNPQAYQEEKQGISEQMQQMQEELQKLAQENEALKSQAQSKEADVALKAAEIELKGHELALKEREMGANIDFRERESQTKHEMESSTPERVQAESERVGMEAFAQAAVMLAEAAAAIAQAQSAPRVMQVVGPSGQVYTGQSAVIDEGQ